jgi:hypothetical protein
MPRISHLLTLAAAGLAAVTVIMAVGPAPTFASHSQALFFEAPRDLLNPATSRGAFAKMQSLGVTAIRVELHWRDVAPAPKGKTRPSFDATSPASYRWGQYDAILAEAQRLKWQVLLTVTAPVPKWATAGHRDFITRPDPQQFEQFMTAVGRHYSQFVSLYAVWNEPNLPRWLEPQFNPNGTPASPRIYRGLWQAAYGGLTAAGIAAPKVLFGETAPFGVEHIKSRREATLREIAPLAFLREALCLSSSYRRSPTCSTLPIYGVAHHPYTYPAVQGPFYRPPEPGEVTIGALSRLSNAIDRASRTHAIPAHIPIYLTEFGVESKPNALGVSLQQQAEYDAISEKISWANPRVVAFSQYLLTDEPAHNGLNGFRTGLITIKGVRKPLYYGFPLPLVVSRSSRGYSLWGLVRPAAGATKVKVSVQAPGSRSFRTLATVKTDSRGYWTLRSSRRGTRWRVSWRSPRGASYNGPSIGAS